jgi:hypothetical protein
MEWENEGKFWLCTFEGKLIVLFFTLVHIDAQKMEIEEQQYILWL